MIAVNPNDITMMSRTANEDMEEYNRRSNRLIDIFNDKKQNLKSSNQDVVRFDLTQLNSVELNSFIRGMLIDNGTKHSFNMSGYDYGEETGQCTVYNLSVLNRFAFLGIYDFTEYLFLDFYKGQPTLYYKYWKNDNNYVNDCLGGYSTSEIIQVIFNLTIFSGKPTRRREY